MFINQIGNSYVTMLKAGYPINVFYGYVTDGLFQNWGEVNRHATQPGTAPGGHPLQRLEQRRSD